MANTKVRFFTNRRITTEEILLLWSRLDIEMSSFSSSFLFCFYFCFQVHHRRKLPSSGTYWRSIQISVLVKTIQRFFFYNDSATTTTSTAVATTIPLPFAFTSHILLHTVPSTSPHERVLRRPCPYQSLFSFPFTAPSPTPKPKLHGRSGWIKLHMHWGASGTRVHCRFKPWR